MGLQSGNRQLQVQSSVQCNTVYDIQNKILSDTIHHTSKWIAIFILVNFDICVLHPSYKIKIEFSRLFGLPLLAAILL
jgi:hypothetical protein